MFSALREGIITPENTVLTNLSNISTVTGWSSFTTKSIIAIDIGNLVFLEFALYGTSNATTASFTLPGWWMQKHTPIDPSSNWYPIRETMSITNNGTRASAPGYAVYADQISAPAGTVNLYRDIASTAFTASGTKSCAGTLVFSKNI